VKAKPKLAAWFFGQVMKQTQSKANPQVVNAILKARLGLPDEG
jgi:aspartyl-tRNA(Asn)/glutamyl-tRNA(Gln) amidotransferase subunit B